MKRNLNLARNILFAIEEAPYDGGLVELSIEGKTDEEVSYHVMILAEAGLIEAKDLSSMAGSDWRPVRLTWEGHEFLDAARDQTRWEKATKIMRERAGGLTFDTLKALLVKLATEAVFN